MGFISSPRRDLPKRALVFLAVAALALFATVAVGLSVLWLLFGEA